MRDAVGLDDRRGRAPFGGTLPSPTYAGVTTGPILADWVPLSERPESVDHVDALGEEDREKPARIARLHSRLNSSGRGSCTVRVGARHILQVTSGVHSVEGGGQRLPGASRTEGVPT